MQADCGQSGAQATRFGAIQFGPVASLREALTFLTRLPIPGAGAGMVLARSMPAFPVAGAMIGVLGGCIYAVTRSALPAFLAALLAQTALCLVTGALHEDGLADTADGLGARGDRAARLAVMRDSRIGAFGAMALMLVLGLRVGALATIDHPLRVLEALVAAHALARAALPGAMRLLPPARLDGLGAGAGQPSLAEAGIAAALAVVIAALALPPAAALASVIGALAGAGGIAWMARRSFGGYTGDILGALEQAVETMALLAIVAALR